MDRSQIERLQQPDSRPFPSAFCPLPSAFRYTISPRLGCEIERESTIGRLRSAGDYDREETVYIQQTYSYMKTKGFHHVAIICSDYEKSKHFYVNVLGFDVIQETFRAARHSYKLDLKVGDNDAIELFSFPEPPARPSRPEACGLRHLAFEVDDLAAIVTDLTAQGIAVEPIRLDDLTGKRFTFFQDPDGLPLELYER